MHLARMCVSMLFGMVVSQQRCTFLPGSVYYGQDEPGRGGSV
jgi:hypothetical protein